jgi:hypothetical protein
MTPSRRQFVAGALAGVPGLMLDTSVLAQRQGSAPAAPDAVMAQIRRELARVYDELKGGAVRVDAIRAFESTLRMHAAHVEATGLDRTVRSRLAARITAVGRASVIDDVVGSAQGHRRHDEIRRLFPRYVPDGRAREPLSAERAETGINAVLVSGASPALISLAAELQKEVERRVAAGPQPVNIRRVQSGDCWAMRQSLNALEVAVALVCALSMIDPALGPVCAVLGFEYAVGQMVYYVTCELF